MIRKAVRGAAWAAPLLACLFAVSCSGSREEYPKNVLDEFMQGCLDTGKARLRGAPGNAPDELAASYCGCVRDGIVKEIPFKDFQALFMDNGLVKDPGSDAARKLADVVTACQAKAQQEIDALKKSLGQ